MGTSELDVKSFADVINIVNPDATEPLQSSNSTAKRIDDIDIYPTPPRQTVVFAKTELTTFWVYQDEAGEFISLKDQCTAWMRKWLREKNILPPSFAPVQSWETECLGQDGRKRITKRMMAILELCSERFRAADFFKSFRCSWSECNLHKCNSILYIALKSKDIADQAETIELECVWNEGCRHHKNSKQRGITHLYEVNFEAARTPNGLCHQSIKEANPVAIAAGNRSGVYLKTETARKAMQLHRKKAFEKSSDPVTNIREISREMCEKACRKDPNRTVPLYGGVHDIFLISSGDLRSVSIYNYLSLKLVSEEVKKNPTATAVIDCTGGLVSDLWISSSSEMARRSLETRKKKPKISGDGKRILVDVLNFHIVFHMPSEGAERMPFAACESVIVERTAIVFEDILRRFRRQLLNFGQGSEHIRFFVTDMAVPLAAAVISVFNNMIIAEYMAIRLFAAKVDDFSLNHMLIRRTLVWCGVHGDRAFKDYAREAYKKSEENLQRDMILFFRNLRMALICTKTYKDHYVSSLI